MTKADPEKLASFIVGSIVGPSAKFSVKKTEENNLIKLEITPAKDDIGKIIGKGGTTIWAIRKLAGIAGVNLKKKILVIVVE